MVLLKFVDNLQHKAWKYIDPNLPADRSARSQAAAECFSELDRVVWGSSRPWPGSRAPR